MNRMDKQLPARVFIALVLMLTGTHLAITETVDEIDRRAQSYYENKEFSKAITEWLKIIDIDPENDRIQRKIEYVYEEKHRKDMALQRAKKQIRDTKKNLQSDFERARSTFTSAGDNFVMAYRIDPKDPELEAMREEMRRLDEEVRIQGAKIRLSRELMEEYKKLLELALKNMDDERYEEAIKNWNDILHLLPLDKTAKEGKRKALLAIENRLKFESIKKLLASGKRLFQAKEYKQAKVEYEEVLKIDPENDEAREYIATINEKLEEKKNYEFKRFQAEQFYVSGLENLRKNNFAQAVEDFENALALIDNYKDIKERLKSIDRLKAEYEKQKKRLRLKEIDDKFRQGLISLTNRNYKDAISNFEDVLGQDRDNKLAREYMNQAKDAMKQREEEAVDEDSPYFGLINSLIISGEKLYKKGAYEESRKIWIRILNLFPNNKIASEYRIKCDIKLNPGTYTEFLDKIFQEGIALLNKKQYRLAINKFQLVGSITPGYKGVEKYIAQANDQMLNKDTGKTASAAEIQARYNLGVDFYSRGGRSNIEAALGHFRWVVSKDPQNMKAIININRIESQLRVGGEAGPAAKRLTEKQEKLIRIYYFRGINYYSNNQFNKAIQEWQKVLAIDPSNTKARNNIRKCLVLLKR